MAYHCPVCDSPDPNRYMRCNHPGCTDGRDPGHPNNIRPRADDGNSHRYHATGLPAGGDGPLPRVRTIEQDKQALRRLNRFVALFVSLVVTGLVFAMFGQTRELVTAGLTISVTSIIVAGLIAVISALHRPE